MPKHQKTKGYDPLIYYTRLELREMYRAEGCSTKEATAKARNLYWKIRQINDKEAYSYNKARELENSFGIGKALDELVGSYENTGEIWSAIGGMAEPDERRAAHYERLRGQYTQKEKELEGAPSGTRQVLKPMRSRVRRSLT